jgi:hypothetical protein
MATSTHDEGRTADRPPRHARRRAARAESRTSDPRKEAAILDDLREGKAGIIKLAIGGRPKILPCALARPPMALASGRSSGLRRA